ncbi:hypothetical protein [Archangium lansingense]|uniref:Uncharacterized protein n=1 Tax=Archangium lansingense TaxID=2995310 RepID=A0ABT4AJY2_9BACT|nr:hypothetical protein [Archangium lansinium]MCY1082002.1 hypothetical protein [Archangium lansinium]
MPRFRYLKSNIDLPPDCPSSAVIREFLRLVFEKYRWFVPMRYEHVPSFEEQLDPDRIDYDALIATYEEHQSLCIAARTDSDFICIFPSTDDSRPYCYNGSILWRASAKWASKPDWRAAHVEQVAEIMRLVSSPLAQASLGEDVERKTRRMIPNEDGHGSTETFTLRNYSAGLSGLFWRNFFGPPFVRMFGGRLASLPEDCRKPLGEELVLVQPYELPTEAGTDQGNARERALIEQLGPECFYDHEHHTPPSRLPALDHLSKVLH